tara:strand:- start:1214 stop:1609 length:396 start_codon:yes stop_codon:yes gene_type:complete
MGVLHVWLGFIPTMHRPPVLIVQLVCGRKIRPQHVLLVYLGSIAVVATTAKDVQVVPLVIHNPWGVQRRATFVQWANITTTKIVPNAQQGGIKTNKEIHRVQPVRLARTLYQQQHLALLVPKEGTAVFMQC